jgi:CheY-like chemotaxis protein
MTGMAGLDDRERALAAGFDAPLAKPIEPTALIATLSPQSLRAGARPRR